MNKAIRRSGAMLRACMALAMEKGLILVTGCARLAASSMVPV
ncbi:hypothetical protein [Massilia frigida]|nr:hypothetical protein [Massilia frigida]